MLKKLTALLLVLFTLAPFTAFANNTAAFDALTVAFNMDGEVTVTNLTNSGTQWELEYGPVGFVINGGGFTTGTISGSTKILNINPFLTYDFRLRYKNFWGVWQEWSTVVTASYCDETYTAPYTMDFEANAAPCWSGYVSPVTAANNTWIGISNEGYSSNPDNPYAGYSLNITSNTTGATAVAMLPPFTDITTDKYITFKLLGLLGGQLKFGSFSNPYDVSTFHLIETIPTQQSGMGWQDATVFFNNYNGTDQYLGFTYVKGYNDNDVNIDNLSYLQGVNCFDLSAFAVSSITEHTASVNFTADAAQTEWEISLFNSAINSTQTFTTTTLPYTLTNLEGNTAYQVKARAICSETQTSDWTTVANFTTTCDNISNGYTTSFGNTSITDQCWTTHTTNYGIVNNVTAYTVNDMNLIVPRTGPYMVQISDPYNANYQAAYISPYVTDIGTDKRIRFYLISRGTSTDYNESNLVIGTVASPDDMASFIPLQTITPQEMSESRELEPVSYWKEHTVYFTNYNSGHHYIVIKHGQQAPDNAFFIDDFTYETIPVCTEPLYATATDIDYNQVTISWQAYSGATAQQWQIEYGPAGFTPGSGTVVTTSTNPTTLTGLNDDTEYEFYVSSVCSGGNSNHSDIGRFRTWCTGVSIGYTHGFENDTPGYMNSCWKRLIPDVYNAYYSADVFINTVQANPPVNTVMVHSGTKSVIHHNYEGTSDVPDAAESTILVLPRLLDFDNFKTISFWMYTKANPYTSPNEIIIGTLSDPEDYTTFTPYYTITNAADFENQWHQYEINFSNFTGTDEYVGIRQGASNGNHVLFFDDFEYGEVACTTASALTAAQNGETSVQLSWNSNNTVNPPASWEIVYGAPDTPIESGTVITVTQNPYTLTGLELYSTYEYRVRNICEGQGYGDWSEPYTFKVSCMAMAPLYESFDSYTYNDNFTGNMCWTANDRNAAYIFESCLPEWTSCPNAAVVVTIPGDYGEPDIPGVFVSPYLSDFDNTKKIKFYASYSMMGAGIQSDLIVGTVTNPTDMSTFVPYTTLVLDPAFSYGKEYEIDFSDYTGTAKHIAFKSDGVDIYHYIAIDDLYYGTINTVCPEPVSVFPKNISSTSALITWENVANANTYAIEYGPHGFTPGSGTTITATGTSQLMDNLASTTTYDVYIYSQCAAAQQSVVVGPKTFTTTCDEIALPYLETFQGLNAYGLNQMPSCYTLITGNVTTYNAPFLYQPDNNIFTGATDESFLFLNEGFFTQFLTPTFALTAGTTYTFSLMGQKSYEYEFLSIRAKVGRGNTQSAMETTLAINGTLHQDEYNPLLYYYTPLVSGNYGFEVLVQDEGSIRGTIDDIALQEGYTALVEDTDASYDFEGEAPEEIILEGTDVSTIGIEDEGGNGYVGMNGNETDGWVDPANPAPRLSSAAASNQQADIWELNQSNITKVNFKISATLNAQSFSFDLKQNFVVNANESRFRIVINGDVYGDVITPETADGDAYQTHTVNLSGYAGQDIRVSLQHIGHYYGDKAFVDNIEVNSTLSAPGYIIETIKLYPNPAHNFVTIENTSVIDRVDIISINGQQLYSSDFNTLKAVADLSAYSAGVYFVKVISAGRQKTFKVIKK